MDLVCVRLGCVRLCVCVCKLEGLISPQSDSLDFCDFYSYFV